MGDINRIGIQKPDLKIQSGKPKKEPLASGKAFENQLLETVNKLKSLDSEVEAMMESTKPQKADGVETSLHLKSKKEDVIAENFTAARNASSKSAKSVALLYEQTKTKQ